MVKVILIFTLCAFLFEAWLLSSYGVLVECEKSMKGIGEIFQIQVEAYR